MAKRVVAAKITPQHQPTSASRPGSPTKTKEKPHQKQEETSIEKPKSCPEAKLKEEAEEDAPTKTKPSGQFLRSLDCWASRTPAHQPQNSHRIRQWLHGQPLSKKAHDVQLKKALGYY